MDYQQSIKNLNHLKNFVRAWAECSIFFFFYSDSDYKIEIYNLDLTDVQNEIVEQNLRSKFPYGFISNEKSGQEILYYCDQNISVECDLFLESTIAFFCKNSIDKKIVQQQFLWLVEFLKNK